MITPFLSSGFVINSEKLCISPRTKAKRNTFNVTIPPCQLELFEPCFFAHATSKSEILQNTQQETQSSENKNGTMFKTKTINQTSIAKMKGETVLQNCEKGVFFSAKRI